MPKKAQMQNEIDRLKEIIKLQESQIDGLRELDSFNSRHAEINKKWIEWLTHELDAANEKIKVLTVIRLPDESHDSHRKIEIKKG